MGSTRCCTIPWPRRRAPSRCGRERGMGLRMSERYRVAFAGVHRSLERKLAGHNWASGFDAVPGIEFSGVFDRGADTRRAFVATWGAMPEYDDYQRMLDELKPDIVCIATRQTMHADE